MRVTGLEGDQAHFLAQKTHKLLQIHKISHRTLIKNKNNSSFTGKKNLLPALLLRDRGPSFSIIFMEGWSATPLPSHPAESGGRRINIV